MKPTETIRFVCDDCLVVFDLCVAPTSEWPDGMDEDFCGEIGVCCCPFCGAADVRALHDRAILS